MRKDRTNRALAVVAPLETPPSGPVAPRPSPPLKAAVLQHAVAEDFTIYQPAGFLPRWYALTLDLALSAPLDVLVHLPFTRYLEKLAAYGHDTKHLVLTVLLSAIPMLTYFIAPTVLWGQTLGKSIVGLRVVRGGFSPDLTVTQVIMRETVGKLLSVLTLGIGFLMVLTDKKRRRALHDLVADTQVIAYRER